MKIHSLTLVAALAMAFALAAATAQTSAPAPVSGASAPPAIKSGPRLLTPAEQRENATAQDESRPEGPLVPQLSIPLGKSAPGSSTKPKLRAARPVPAASGGGINDEVARCEAQTDTYMRARCREQLAQQGRGR